MELPAEAEARVPVPSSEASFGSERTKSSSVSPSAAEASTESGDFASSWVAAESGPEAESPSEDEVAPDAMPAVGDDLGVEPRGSAVRVM